jgi:hypothetical protein
LCDTHGTDCSSRCGLARCCLCRAGFQAQTRRHSSSHIASYRACGTQSSSLGAPRPTEQSRAEVKNRRGEAIINAAATWGVLAVDRPCGLDLRRPQRDLCRRHDLETLQPPTIARWKVTRSGLTAIATCATGGTCAAPASTRGGRGCGFSMLRVLLLACAGEPEVSDRVRHVLPLQWCAGRQEPEQARRVSPARLFT